MRKKFFGCIFVSLAVAMGWALQSSAKQEVIPIIEREVTIVLPYLNLPVKTGEPKRRVSLTVEGNRIHDFDIELAADEPDFWVFVDVSGLMGKRVLLRVERSQGSEPATLDRITQDDRIKGSDDLYREKHRPQFHFTSRRGWNNDPNGLVYSHGEYHLFYQHNPYGWGWGNMHWGHAVSADLVHWRELGEAIRPDALGAVFSGSAVVDPENTAGFQAGEGKIIVCIYTSAGDQVRPSAPFTQSIAFSTDNGRTFTKYGGNPVVGHITGANRDPKVIWHEPTQKWIMALYLDKNDFALLSSPDLKNWTRLYGLQIPGASECPDIFELPVDGNPQNTKWVIWAANGSYLVGSFDGRNFTAESGVLHAYAGGTAYAAQTYSGIPESDGRRIQIPWLRCDMTGMPFNQQMGFPVELTLRTTEDGIRLHSEPVNEIKTIHGREWSWKSQKVEPGQDLLQGIAGELFDIRAEVTVKESTELGFVLRGIPVMYDAGNQILSCQNYSVSFKPRQGRIRLRILVDRASIEVFGNDGRLYMPIGLLLPENDRSLKLFVRNSPATIETLSVHEVKSIWNKDGLLDDNFSGLQHIGLPVTDLDRSVGFYKKLGFEKVMGKAFDDGGGLIRVAMMEREGVVMELYQLPPDQVSQDILVRRDGRLDHIAFTVKDIDKAFEEVKRAGLVPLQDAPVKLDFWERGCRYFSIRGPDGEKLEFNQIL